MAKKTRTKKKEKKSKEEDDQKGDVFHQRFEIVESRIKNLF